MLRRVLVLNFTYEPINICSLRRAVVLILGEKAEIIEEGEGLIRSEKICLAQPFVIRLKYYVKVPRGRRRRISRKAILARDRFRCQYCGSTRHLTLDHVIPRSRGGSTTWATWLPPVHRATPTRATTCRARLASPPVIDPVGLHRWSFWSHLQERCPQAGNLILQMGRDCLGLGLPRR